MNALRSLIQKSQDHEEKHSTPQTDKQKLVGLVHLVVFSTCLVGGTVMYIFDMQSYLSLFVLGIVCFLGWLLNRAGHPKISAAILIIALLCAIQFNIFAGFGIHDVAIIAWPALIFFAGLLFGWRVIPYTTGLIMFLAVVTKIIPNAHLFADLYDTGDLIIMLLILAAFSIIAMSILRSNEQSIQALSESEERYRHLYENSTVGLYRTTPDGQFLLANPTMVKMMGFTSFDELSARNLEKEGYAPDYERRRFRELIGKTGEVKGLETAWTRTDGTTIFVRESASATHDVHGKTLYYDGIIEDVTEHKRAEEALQESESLLRLAQKIAHIGHFKFNPATGVVEGSDELFNIFGLNRDQSQFADFASSVHPEDRASDIAFIETAMSQATDYEREHRLLLPDGTLKWICLIGRFTSESPREPRLIIGTVQDITERKRAEDALQKSEARYRFLAENTADVIWSLSIATGKFTYVSPSVLKLRGYTPDEVLTQTMGDSITPDYSAEAAELIQQRFKAFMAGDSSVRVMTNQVDQRRKDGTVVPTEVVTTLVSDAQGKLVDIVGVTRDITERKLAEKSLEEITARLKEAQRIALMGNWELNLENNQLTWSDEVFRIFEIDPARFGATYEAFLSAIHPYDRQFVDQAYATSIADRKPYDTDHRLLMPDGRVKYVHERCETFFDENGRAVRSNGTVQEITDRKQSENELKAIANLSTALRSATTRIELLPVIVNQLSASLNCPTMSVETIDPVTDEIVVEAATGAWIPLVGFRQPPGTGLSAIVRETGQLYHQNNLIDTSGIAIQGEYLEGIHSLAGVPLIAQDQLIGILWMGRTKEIAESEDRMLIAVADIAANALHRATLYEQTLKYAADLTHAYNTTLEGWVNALELRDQETVGHARNVVQMTVDLASSMDVSSDELEHVRRGALLHDIGKMGIPDSVLLKPGTLNEREWEIMRRHPEYAYQLLKPIEYLNPVLDIPYCHHEKWDGSGYPQGLKGEEIPLLARIFAVVDVWDALRSDRPYRKAWSREQAQKYLQDQSGKHFDPQVVKAFFCLMQTGQIK